MEGPRDKGGKSGEALNRKIAKFHSSESSMCEMASHRSVLKSIRNVRSNVAKYERRTGPCVCSIEGRGRLTGVEGVDVRLRSAVDQATRKVGYSKISHQQRTHPHLLRQVSKEGAYTATRVPMKSESTRIQNRHLVCSDHTEDLLPPK